MLSRLFVFVVLFTPFLSSVRPIDTVVIVRDTVRVNIPDDSLTRYILAEMAKIERKMVDSNSTADASNPFEVATFEIFRREGYVPKPYQCPAGLETIGFGDVIDTPEERTYKTGMPFSAARAKVYANFKTGVDEINRRFPGKYNDPAQLLALCMLGHSIGWDRLERKYPPFYAEIAAGKPSARWLKYCRYIDGRTGRVKKSSNLERTRRVEWLLFNRDWPALTKYHTGASRVVLDRFNVCRFISLQTLGRE